MTKLMHTARAFAETLWVTRKGRSRASFEAWQAAKLKKWLAHDLPKVGFYANGATCLSSLPIIDKSNVMAQFEDFNLGRISSAQGWAAFEDTGQIGKVSIGASTGTSGNRALYAVTPAERFRWLGTILAKTVPGFLFAAERVAVILPQSSDLYDGANQTGRMALRFFDLRSGVETWLDRLEQFDPTTIVAPPRVLRHLAEQNAKLHPKRLYSGAETLDPMDRKIIEAAFSVRLGQIYMATEGLFAVTCAHGNLHLAEDANHFELQPVGDGLVTPLVTGFRRQFQIMARYRMNDLLRMSDQSCSCGSPLRVVDEVVGRMDDAFLFGGRLVTPDVMRNAVLNASRDITDFRIRRESERVISLVLRPDISPEARTSARNALSNLFGDRGLSPVIQIKTEPLCLNPSRKLRRVENCWSSEAD